MNVLLIHGLGRTPLSLLNLERRLQQAGHRTELFGYFAFNESYDRIVERLQIRLHALAMQGRYGVVAHSLGGLLVRSALGSLPIAPPAHIIMLGTPNQPPRLAAHAWHLPPFQWFSGQCGFNLTSPDFYAAMPALQAPYTIVAGICGPRGVLSPFGMELNDGIVALSETRLSDQDRIVQLDVWHTFMMNDRAVQETVLQCLQENSLTQLRDSRNRESLKIPGFLVEETS
ncbi:alpha/beta hydrolase [Leptodesmis sichuanensis]|uniref:alpha/beta hydrolase n=1 Tax=Leptodesmis sichuanensis TaxID=2906798 RepID=UPI001F2739C2|nr:alpha/beta hydrolase [Leptodesmis sichuanensis]UIE39667.1 alpha/beta hydrolase [Leptodesmis sichuanensis A121]